jgi:hypothetical protein
VGVVVASKDCLIYGNAHVESWNLSQSTTIANRKFISLATTLFPPPLLVCVCCFGEWSENKLRFQGLGHQAALIQQLVGFRV